STCRKPLWTPRADSLFYPPLSDCRFCAAERSRPMTRLWCALSVVVVCAGCRNAPPVTDPFLGAQTIPPPGTAVLAPNAPVAPPYYGATTSPPTSAPIVSSPVTSPTPAVPPATPTTPPPTTAPYQYNMPQNYRPSPTGFSSVTPNVSLPAGGGPMQSASG